MEVLESCEEEVEFATERTEVFSELVKEEVLSREGSAKLVLIGTVLKGEVDGTEKLEFVNRVNENEDEPVVEVVLSEEDTLDESDVVDTGMLSNEVSVGTTKMLSDAEVDEPLILTVGVVKL